MKSTTAFALALPALSSAAQTEYVTSEKLQELINIEDLISGAQELQDIADANGGNRAFGGSGHNATVDWIVETLEATGYYDVVKQPFTELYSGGQATLFVDGVELNPRILTYTPDGIVSGPLVEALTLGCTPEDYPIEVEGAIAFVSRGNCPFAEKSIAAKAAGATAIIVYNNIPGSLSGSLGDPFPGYAPIVGISQEEAVPILEALEVGAVNADLNVDATIEDRVSFNIIAETKGGDHDNVLVVGGHTDSVSEGPGINDNGSGSVGILRVAEALAHFNVKNAIRFAWWSAEEFGLLGSYYYIQQFNGSQVELGKIRAYLNFDMIASPNYIYGIYDGDGSAFNLTGPAGSAAIEKDFEDFFRDSGSNSVPTEFSGRSDYAAFIGVGIPSGGLFTGAEFLKTPEEAILFGGEAGVSYDVNYHLNDDDVDNLNSEAFLLNSKSIANSVAKYAISFDSLGAVDLSERRWAADRRITARHTHAHSGGPCGGSGSVLK